MKNYLYSDNQLHNSMIHHWTIPHSMMYISKCEGEGTGSDTSNGLTDTEGFQLLKNCKS